MTFRCRSNYLILLAFLAIGWGSSAMAARDKALDLIGMEQIQQIFPAAEVASATSGELPTRRVYGDGELLGYVYLSDEIIAIPAYSGRPIRMLIGLGLDAHIRSAIILHHEEPILVIGITDADLKNFIDQYSALDANQRVRIGAHNREGYKGVDGITGATRTSQGIDGLLRFWLGDFGFGPYLRRIREEQN
jgi:transcriptional regulator of nitric oxide reductase